MKRLSLIDVVVLAAVVALVVFTFIPAVARIQRSYAEAKCQSNLYRWSEAIALYCADNAGRYPTNRSKSNPNMISFVVALSPPEPLPGETQLPRHLYGINWVEALYSYMEDFGTRTDQDWRTFRRCPRSRRGTWPTPSASGYPYPCIDYVFNHNLAEYWAGLVRNPHKVMMLREFFKTTIAVLRPVNFTTGNSVTRPQYAFNNGDSHATIGENNDPSLWKIHGDGSYIAFADGHVKYFSLDYYPPYSQMNASNSWDPETGQWWNYAPGSNKPAELIRSIAVTP